MYYNLPRIACYKDNNIIHLLNGIGNFETDLILVLKEGRIFSYQLKNYR